jgi:uncharacterized protein (TIGR00725 family)
MLPNKQQPIICVSGAAETGHCGEGAMKIAYTLGEAIAKNGCIITTGATTGFPTWAAAGARKAGGYSIGLSPAANKEEHMSIYKAPTEDMDFILYTGFGYPGRDMLLVRSSEAVIFGCGRIGTIHEFTIAFEDNKPIGILEGTWMTDEVINTIIKNGNRDASMVIFDNDPERLVKKIKEMILVQREDIIRRSNAWRDD